jgi:hypothetical protein
MTLDGTDSITENMKEVLQFVESTVRMGIYGVAPTVCNTTEGSWAPIPTPPNNNEEDSEGSSVTYGEACVIEEMEEGPPKSKTHTRPAKDQKDDSDTSTDPEFDYIPCEICNRADNWAQMLLCDRCDHGYHMKCLTPPMFRIPDDSWFCPACKLEQTTGEMEDAEVIDLTGDNTPSAKEPDVLDDRPVMALLKQSEEQ